MCSSVSGAVADSIADSSDSVFATAWVVSLTLTVCLVLQARPWESPNTSNTGAENMAAVEDSDSSQTELAILFLPVWFFCVAGDWLQGPYVYALYEAYGFPRDDIARLFVTGYGASLVFGTYVGSWIDTIGRKRGCQLYCLLYIVACVSKHFGNIPALFIGRLAGGVATSLLFSAFESWLIGENAGRSSGTPRLGRIFALMWFGSSVVAILAGEAGDAVAGLLPFTAVAGTPDFHYGGVIAPFDLAALLLVVGLSLLSTTWMENRGESLSVQKLAIGEAASSREQVEMPLATLSRGVDVIKAKPTLLALMAVVTGFESATYAFVFNWTPAIESSAGSTPNFGGVFATLMLAYMAGTSVFQLMSMPGYPASQTIMPRSQMPAVVLLQASVLFGSLALVMSALALTYLPSASSICTAWCLGGFVAFEFCCGLYAPAMSAVKSALVPEELRSTVYNTYRVPMNATVLIILLSGLSTAQALFACVGLLLAASLATRMLPEGNDPPVLDTKLT